MLPWFHPVDAIIANVNTYIMSWLSFFLVCRCTNAQFIHSLKEAPIEVHEWINEFLFFAYIVLFRKAEVWK